MRVKFTIVENTKGLLTKSIAIGPDGNVVKDPRPPKLFQGRFKTVEVNWDEFDQAILGLKHNQAIMSGIHVDGLNSGEIGLVEDVKANPREGLAARSDISFGWREDESKLLVLDFDHLDLSVKGAADELGMQGIIEKLFVAAPVMRNFDYWLFPSSGAYIWKRKEGEGALAGEMEPYSMLSGFHAYFLIGPGLRPGLIMEYLKVKCALAGEAFAWINSEYKVESGKNPHVNLSYLIDHSAFQQSRLFYSSGRACGEGFEQRRGAMVRLRPGGDGSGAGEAFINQSLFFCSQGEKDEARARGERIVNQFKISIGHAEIKATAAEIRAKMDGVSPDVVKKSWGRMEHGQLWGSVKVLLDSGEWVKAWMLKAYPLDYDKKTCHDPIEPDYGGSSGDLDGGSGAKNKAIIYSNGDRCTIISQAHGEYRLTVVYDMTSVVEILGMYNGTAEGLEKLGSELGENWLLDLTQSEGLNHKEQLRVLELIKEKFASIGKYESVNDVKRAAAAALNDKGLTSADRGILEEINLKYATAEIGRGSQVRVLYRGPDPIEGIEGKPVSWYMQKKEDFLAANGVSLGMIRVSENGKIKMKRAADFWLNSWLGRKHYSLVVFDPTAAPGGHEYEGKMRLNKWEGYREEPKVGRSCGKNRGCFQCFVDGGYRVCPAQSAEGGTGAGVTWWLRHIFECVCSSDVSHFHWVLDWLVDVIQNPGGAVYGEDGVKESMFAGGRTRPGTALIVHGEEKGTGKEVVIMPLLKLLGNAALQTHKMDSIAGKFNAALESKVLVFADEATWGKGNEVKSALKSLVTSNTLPIEPKGIDSYDAKNFVRLYCSSNNEQAYPAEDGERRAAIFKILAHRKGQQKEWFDRFVYQDLGILLDEMLHWKIKSNLKVIPITASLIEHKNQYTSKKIENAFIQYMIDQAEQGDIFVWDDSPERVGNIFHPEQLRGYYDKGEFAKFKHEGHATLTWEELKMRMFKRWKDKGLVGHYDENGRTFADSKTKKRGYMLNPLCVCKKIVDNE